MKFIKVFVAICCLALASCAPTDPNNEIDEGVVKDNVYESKEIGWSIEIPKGWTAISHDKQVQNDERGLNAIEESSGMEVDVSKLKHLISFQKDQFNIFQSTSEPFEETFPGEFDQNQEALYEILYSTFAARGINVDTAWGKETVQGLEFHVFYSTLYGPDGEVVLRQILYSRLINGYAFGANINYNNEEDKEVMMEAWESSTFK